MDRMRIENDPSEDDEAHKPIRPSAKALGKRRVIEDPEGTMHDHVFLECDH